MRRAAAACALAASAADGASLRSLVAAALGSGAGEPARTLGNIGVIMRGQDIFTFNTWDPEGQRAQIFEASYSKNLTTADANFLVPDGFSVTSTTRCSTLAKTSQVSGETSLRETQSTQVDISASASFGPMSGSLQNSNKMTSLSSSMSKSDSFLQVTELTCELYQVNLQVYDQPMLTQDFVLGLEQLYLALKQPAASGDTNLTSKAERFVAQFGTHYMSRGSMGSKYMQTFESTRVQTQKLESSGVDIAVAAQASMVGTTAAASVLTSTQKEQASYFNSFSSVATKATLGTMLPSGSSNDEVIKNWQEMTIKAGESKTGLAFVSGFGLRPIDELLTGPTALQQLNAAQKKHRCKVIMNAKQMSDTRAVIVQAVSTECSRRKLSCSGPANDKPLPEPLKVSKQRGAQQLGSPPPGDGGAPFETSPEALYGLSQLTYDIRPVLLESWWRPYEKTSTDVLSAYRITFVDAKGNQRVESTRGSAQGTFCKIAIPSSEERVQTINLRAGTYIDYIRLISGKGTVFGACGNSQGGGDFNINAPKPDDYWLGFAGSSGEIVDKLSVVTAVLA